MKLNNKKCIRRLSIKSMQAVKSRNIIAVIAISLTALLFTALFTIVGSMTYGFEQSNFRMVGTCAHGEFKQLTNEQYEILKGDKAISEYGMRRVLGIACGEEFSKLYTEISYMSENTAEWSFIVPESGRLPLENTNEAAADIRILKKLGITPEIGTEFKVKMDVDGDITEETFVLSGYWEGDEASPACHILIPYSRTDEVFKRLDTVFNDPAIGSYSMDVMLKHKGDIASELSDVLVRNGFSADERDKNHIKLGINWGYMSQGLLESLDFGTAAAFTVIVMFIVLTGYMIINNVFRISVANQTRHYGLLKTIGTTGRQIRTMVLTQAFVLSLFGVPVGLILGWISGAALTPVVMNELDICNAGVAVNPFIFIFSGLFALFTVIISCLKPMKTAASVSPIEAVRYTESSGKSAVRKTGRGVSPFGMAAANLGRSRTKTILTSVSLALSVVLFSITYIFADSFSMEKYLSGMTTADFVISDVSYFNVSMSWEPERAISVEETEIFKNLGGVSDIFMAYGSSVTYMPQTFYTEQQLYNNSIKFSSMSNEEFETIKEASEKRNGKYLDIAQTMGVNKALADKISVIEGDISLLSEDGYIAVEKGENFKPGDKITLVYTDACNVINKETGEKTDIDGFSFDSGWTDIDTERITHEKEYTVCAVVDVSYASGYGYSLLSDFFILDSEIYLNEIKSAAPLYVAINVEDEHEAAAEEFIASYTESSDLDYTSKVTMAEEFESFRRMFVILGTVLSGIVGLIGLLNFTNTILTGIFARRHELSVLRSIGMTGKQLKTMLIYEGLLYTASAVITGLTLNILMIPMSSVIEKIFWFCEYRFSPVPILITAPLFIIVGIVLPLITYRSFNSKTIVERLREAE